MKKLTTGDKIWMSSVLLYIIWVLFAFYKLDMNINTIAISGSIGMIAYVIIGCISVLIYYKIIKDKDIY